jgi:hypothetical protein
LGFSPNAGRLPPVVPSPRQATEWLMCSCPNPTRHA